jgi:hypothetical protein
MWSSQLCYMYQRNTMNNDQDDRNSQEEWLLSSLIKLLSYDHLYNFYIAVFGEAHNIQFNMKRKFKQLWSSTFSLIWKESLSDGHQFHQNQQNEQSPLILTTLTEHKKNSMTYEVGNPGPGLGQAQECGRVKLVNKISILLSW